MSLDDSTGTRRPVLAELVGPAGAGKTTQAEALCRRNKDVTLAPIPILREARSVPYFIRNFLFLLPIVFRLRRDTRSLSWDATKMMIHLNGWDSKLAPPVPSDIAVTLLDHGPVFMLATLLEFVPQIADFQRSQRWFDSMLKKWSSLLAMVIWLDAPYPVLAERINTRNRRHIVKGKGEDEIIDFLARYRKSFERVMLMLAAEDSGLRVLRFETDQELERSITDRIVAALEMPKGG